MTDPDPRVFAACRKQVLSWGAAALPVLRRAVAGSDPRLRVRARALLRIVGLRAWADDVQRLARAFLRVTGGRRHDPFALEKGALLLTAIGRVEQPEGAPLVAVVEREAAALRECMHGRTAASCARALGDYLSRAAGYTADRASYYDLDAILLDTVARRKRAIPLVLALWYVILGRRVGLRASAVALPDQYLVRIHGARPVLVDPAREGNTVTKGDCVRHLRAKGYSDAPSSYLEDLDDRRLLLAYVDALQQVFGYREDGESLAALRRARDALAGVAG